MDWAGLRPLIDAVNFTTGGVSPGGGAFLDQYGAELRDRFDALGLSVTDEVVVAASLATIDAALSLIVECHEADGMTAAETLSAYSVLCVLARPLLEFLPAVAR